MTSAPYHHPPSTRRSSHGAPSPTSTSPMFRFRCRITYLFLLALASAGLTLGTIITSTESLIGTAILSLLSLYTYFSFLDAALYTVTIRGTTIHETRFFRTFSELDLRDVTAANPAVGPIIWSYTSWGFPHWDTLALVGPSLRWSQKRPSSWLVGLIENLNRTRYRRDDPRSKAWYPLFPINTKRFVRSLRATAENIRISFGS